MIDLTSGRIAEITGGDLIDGQADNAEVTGPAEFDSRKVVPGAIFMALPGANVDGHDYVTAAAENGAALSIVGRSVGQPALLAQPVEDDEAQRAMSNSAAFEADADGSGAAVLRAIDRLARYNTDVLAEEEGMTVVGVTGSAGKILSVRCSELRATPWPLPAVLTTRSGCLIRRCEPIAKRSF